jgi:muramoyltetrapeptide carboxypeptidase
MTPDIPPDDLPVYLISPSGAVAPEAPVDRALANLRAAGFAPVLDRAALRVRQRFAGSDEDRAAAFTRAAAQPASVVMTTRGGYGLTRILPKLDFTALAAADKRWVGLSDFTAFQLAMLARANAVTWAGPALLEDFAAERAEDLDEITVGTFRDAMDGSLEILGFRYSGPKDVEARGTLWGGNLSIVCALLGTPWFPQVDGGILFLEDVNEHPYRIERMLTQLLHAGVLDRQAAIVFGCFNRYRLVESDCGFDLPAVVKWLRTQTKTPILTGLPFGHASPKLTLPHGATVGLATEGRTCWLVLEEHHHEDPPNAHPRDDDSQDDHEH